MGHNGIILLAIVALVAILSIAWHGSRSRTILERWAAQSGYRILSAHQCWFFRGPFFLRTGKGQAVYRITVQDAQGGTRSGYVKCGGAVLGLLSDVAKVKWDDER